MLERFYRELLNFLHRQVDDRDTAADLAQESYARVLAAEHAGQPLLNALTTQRHLGHSLAAGDWVMAGMDLGALGLACAFALAARRTGPRSR